MRIHHPTGRDHTPVRLALVVLTATLVFVAAGCGGDNSEAEKWANSVCSTVSDWQGQIEQAANDVRDELQSPGVGTVASIETQIRTAVDATQKLTTDLKAIDAPDIDSGAEAKQQVDALASQLEASVNVAKDAVDALPENASLTELAQKLVPLAPAIQTLADSASNTLEAIEASSDELKDGFNNADACKPYR
jgi:septal ring factor EnvC (AmiA/AmiB activator)